MTALLATPTIDVNGKDTNSYTSVMWAAKGGHIEAIKILLEAPGIDVNIADTEGHTALSACVLHSIALFTESN